MGLEVAWPFPNPSLGFYFYLLLPSFIFFFFLIFFSSSVGGNEEQIPIFITFNPKTTTSTRPSMHGRIHPTSINPFIPPNKTQPNAFSSQP